MAMFPALAHKRIGLDSSLPFHFRIFKLLYHGIHATTAAIIAFLAYNYTAAAL